MVSLLVLCTLMLFYVIHLSECSCVLSIFAFHIFLYINQLTVDGETSTTKHVDVAGRFPPVRTGDQASSRPEEGRG